MKRLLLLTAAAGAVAAAIIVPALADDRHEHQRDRMWSEMREHAGHDMGPGMMGRDMFRMMQMMHRMHGDDEDGDDAMEHGRMFAMRGGMFPFAAFDADDDGRVTPDELRTGLLGALKTYDADGDGTLSLAEFETLLAALTREHTVDRFQALDADGDGKVTADEMAAPAKRLELMLKHRDEKTPPGGG